jgi:hypothetical protein
MRRGVGDRRAKPRFEIVGQLGGTLETPVVLSLHNAGRGGVLADSPVPLAIGAEYRVMLHCDGIQAPAHVIVRHVRSETMNTGEKRFLVGFEFVAQTPAIQGVLDRWVLLHGGAGA